MDIRADSTEYATATVTTDHDLTGKTFEVALPETGIDPATWFVADVVSVTDLGNGSWKAIYRLLLGPTGGSVTLTKGITYDWVLKITDTPEVPIRVAGTVNAT